MPTRAKVRADGAPGGCPAPAPPPRLLELLPYARERIVLRRLGLADLEAFHAYRSDPDVGRFQGWTATDLDTAAAFLTRMSSVTDLSCDDWIQLAIADAATDRLIGDVGIFLDASGIEAEIGYTLAAQWHGRGLGSESVEAAIELIWASSDAKVIRGITDARNMPSIRVLERVGMVREREMSTEFRGERCIEYCYALHRGSH